MKTSVTLLAAFAAAISMVSAVPQINTAGVPTSCGQNTCCIPSCNLEWSDGQGCTDGQASIIGACNETFSPSDDTTDTGVDICDGAGAFYCATTGGGRAIFVINRDGNVAAALFPATYDECTLSGQCAPCDGQGGCQDPVEIGHVDDHNCQALNALLDGANSGLTQC